MAVQLDVGIRGRGPVNTQASLFDFEDDENKSESDNI